MIRYTQKKAKKAKRRLVDSDEDSGEDEDDSYSTVKCGLLSIVRPPFRDILISDIEAKPIESTKICVLGSLLLLYKIQSAYDTGHRAFFEQDGATVIKDCFHGVLIQNVHSAKMSPEFRHIFENLPDRRTNWPYIAQTGQTTIISATLRRI